MTDKILRTILLTSLFLAVISVIMLSLLGVFSKTEAEVIESGNLVIGQVFLITLFLGLMGFSMTAFILWVRHRDTVA